MTAYERWAKKYPEAAKALQDTLTEAVSYDLEAVGKSEAYSQQAARLSIAKQGALGWRNNVGATPAKTICPECGHVERVQPIRYGLANDSAKLNKEIKSSDIIAAIPRLITPDMVGRTIAQFGAIETKRPGWTYTGRNGEPQQAAFLAKVAAIGGYALFSTGEVPL